MKRLAVTSHFQKQLKKLHRQEQEKAAQALKQLLEGLKSGEMPIGLGFKKINGDKYEVRVDIRRRIVLKADGDTLVCHLLSFH